MGEVFAGRYELIDPIGRGGVGAVWRAWDHRRRRYVAAKVLQQSDAHTLLRFVREQALRIDHPHVLAPASWAADDDKVLFTMDLVAGGSLAHVIGDYGALPPRFVCVLLDQLLSGLAAVHAEGVVHRDIKPANILLDVTGAGRPHLRLSDFGISMRKGEPRLTETDHVMGTPGYFAPEQLRGAEPDFAADLFAVGLVALYLLQGRKPDSQALVEYFLTHGTPGAPQGIPEPLWQVLAGLLQPDPHARFRTATGARKALNAAVELLPVPMVADEPVEVFDQIGPLPTGFGPNGPEPTGPEAPTGPTDPAGPPLQEPPAQRPPAHLPGMSETGSFHLPPPPRTPTQPVAVPPSPAHAPAHTPVQTPQAPQPLPAPTVPAGPAAFAQIPTAAVPQSRPRTQVLPARRPGPPAKVAVPVLFAALVCFAVGIWALIQA
ncbi:protein kinase [Streptomyces sp. NPDC093111]|uniref:serine/threonine-protein kinase n=1 Tax=Streptomyces sp. NPDC093111 TaxID=3154978 RepID=UPI0034449FDE